MKNLFLKTIIFIVLFFIAKPVFGAVVINEVAWMGTEINSSNEWIELYNNTDSPTDIKNWSIYGADTNECLNFSNADSYVATIIPAYDYLIYANHKDDIENSDGLSVVDIWDATIGMNNTSPGQMVLYNASDCTGGAVDTINQSTKWLEGNSGTKQTMERTATDWQTSLNPGGTPKTQNSTGAIEEPASESEDSETEQETGQQNPISFNPPVADAGNDIIGFINQEIKFDGTNSSDVDNDELAYAWNMGNGKLMEKPNFTYKYMYPGTYLATLMVYDGKYYAFDTITIKIQSAQITINEFMANPSGKDEEEEWIEVYNDADTIVDISGWQLDDTTSGSAAFTFPKNTLIAPKSYLVFPRQITGIALNNDKDSVRLLLPEGIVFQEINYEKPLLGKSSARTDEGFVWGEPTPGMANIINPSTRSGQASKNFVYQQPITPETVKYSAVNNIIDYQNNINQEIDGGYINKNDQFLISNDQIPTNNNQTASIKPLSSQQNPLNLILLIISIIFGSALIGLLLIKFRKKHPLPRTAGLPN